MYAHAREFTRGLISLTLLPQAAIKLVCTPSVSNQYVPFGITWAFISLGAIGYTGGDIVPAIIENNQRQFETAQRRFVVLDLTRDPLLRADVVLCRDCLVHLSFRHIAQALANLRASGAKWLLTTTFTAHPENQDIEDGDWRMLNLERPPFSFPKPEAVLVEGCQEGGGAYADKSLGLWRVAALP